MSGLIPVELIENKIFVIRGCKVMLDSDLAQLYGVETKNLNKAVKRNIKRFPDDFMFQLTDEEWENLRFQIGTSNKKTGGRRYNPYVFTEQGVAMLSGVLNSDRAIAVNVQIMRTFVKLRELVLTNNDLAKRLDEMERGFIQYARENNRGYGKSLVFWKNLFSPYPTSERLKDRCGGEETAHLSLSWTKRGVRKNEFFPQPHIQIEEIYRQLDYLKDVTKPEKIGFKI